MLYIVILAIIFLVMLSAPFASAMIYCRNKKGDILFIRQEKTKDARYFGKSFAQRFEENLASRENGVINLSKEEEYLCADKQTEYPETVDKLVMCLNGDLTLNSNVKNFEKEIYGAHNVINPNKGVNVRAIYAKNNMILAENTEVERWIDAENTVAIYDGCDLGISATAGKRLSIGNNCVFQRLYAPEILIGQYPQNTIDPMDVRNPAILVDPKTTEIIRDVENVTREIANEKGEIDASILTRHELMVLEELIVRGNVCSHKSVRLCDGSVVAGNIFAEEDIHIGKNATVLGNIFTQGSVYVEEGAMIGEPGAISSIIAREHITFEKNITVFGYVSCERGGKVSAGNMEEVNNKYAFLDLPKHKTELKIETKEDLENIDEQGFRKEELLSNVEISVDMKEVQKSMFFSCHSLEKVVLPNTIREIGSYAFADCSSLKDITSFGNMPLKVVGTSAFENCKSLEIIEFPKALEEIGGAAFAGCESLKKVSFAEECNLKSIGSHSFRGCRKLEELFIPDKVQAINLSAFMDCESLRDVSIPSTCQREPGIMELRKIPGVQIRVRSLGTLKL